MNRLCPLHDIPTEPWLLMFFSTLVKNGIKKNIKSYGSEAIYIYIYIYTHTYDKTANDMNEIPF